MLIYIDTDCGSWGVGEKNLVIFDVDSDEAEALEEMSDSQICQFGLDNRHRN